MFKTVYEWGGGRLSVDVYEKINCISPFYGPKYFWRPITRKMNKGKLLNIIKWYIPKYIGFDIMIRPIRINDFPLGQYILGLLPIPCWNYIDWGYTDEERIQHAIMDTFDALSPYYDRPCSEKELKQWGEEMEFEWFRVFHGSNGLVLNARR